MKITSIQIKNVFAVKAIYLAIDRSAILFGGHMEQGKTAINDAIRIALLGEPGRVAKKKDWPAIVRRGADKGVVELAGVTGGAEWLTRTTLPTGTIKSAGRWCAGHALADIPLCPERFARGMTSIERRTSLLELLHVDAGGNELVRRLIVRGANTDKVQALAATLVKFGAPIGHESANDKTRQARADWKALTGEDYGDIKAQTWVPTVPSAPLGTTLNGVRIELKAVEQNIAECNQEIGRMEAQRIAFEGYEKQANGLRQRAGLASRSQAALETARKDFADMTARIAAVEQAAAEATKPVHTRPCPSCGTVLEDDGDTLIVHQHRESRPMPEDYGRLPSWREAASMLERSIENHTRTIEEAKAAQSTLDMMTKEAPVAVAQEDIDEVRAGLRKLEARRRELSTLETEHLNHETMVNKASETRDRAAALHRDVQEWKEIAALLAPDGIPGEILTEGLEPFRARLRQTALRTGWPVVNVRDDMEITVGDDLYGLCSKSAQWRADAVLAEAVAHVSGLRFLLLDGMDVLDMRGRVALIGWLTTLTRSGELDQCIVNGTFTQRPGGGDLQEWQVEWVAAGEIEQTEAETA